MDLNFKSSVSYELRLFDNTQPLDTLHVGNVLEVFN